MTRWRLTALVLTAVAAGVGGYLVLGRGDGGRSAPGAPRGLEIGIQDHPVFVQQDYYGRERGFARARQLGVSWMRVIVPWHRVVGGSAGETLPPSALAYGWAPYDGAVQAALDHGVNVELSLAGPAPAWATGDRRVGTDRPDAALFAGFARAAALHFRGRVRRYSIWNEPNHRTWLSPQSAAPAVYRRLYQAGWSAIKRVDPGAQVLIGETAPYRQFGLTTAPLRFLRAVVCATPAYTPAARCSGLRADGYAHHPYDFLDPPERPYPGADNVTIGSLGRLTGALDRLARARLLATPDGRPLPVYLTEFGYFTRGRRALPQATRAAYLRRAFDVAAQAYPRVRQLLQYLLVSPPPGYLGGHFDTSLLTRSGAPTPAFDALTAWAAAERRFGRIAPPGRP